MVYCGCVGLEGGCWRVGALDGECWILGVLDCGCVGLWTCWLVRVLVVSVLDCGRVGLVVIVG